MVAPLPQRENTRDELLDRVKRDPRWLRLWERLLTPRTAQLPAGDGDDTGRSLHNTGG